MRISKVILVAVWVLCVVGIVFDFDDRVWQFIRSHGFGGHAIGLLFVWIPFAILALEWIAAIVVPVLFLRDYSSPHRER
ncbi:MAG: hypothetical protein QG602_282 [Verrucomicrobiota bacterium]|nr:hypothetical protein [Verrucomicrobiota bacterium]